MKPEAHPPRIYWIDFMRAIAILSVVWLHVDGRVVAQFGNIPTLAWWWANISQALVRTSVPLFFMISGALYLGRVDDWKLFLQKRAIKILIPLIVWAVIYQMHDLKPPYFEALLRLAKNIIEGNVAAHLWFFYALIGLYLIMPILQIFVRQAERAHLLYFVGLWFTAAAVFPFLDQTTDWYPGIDLRLVSGYVGYLILGYLLAHFEIKTTRQWTVVWGLFFLSLCATSLGAYLERRIGAAEPYAYQYLSPNVIVMAGACFLILKYLAEQRSPNNIVLQLSQASFGIYLVHIAVLSVFDGRLHLTALSGNPLTMTPFVWLADLAVSYAIVKVLQKIPVVRAIVP